MAVLSPGPTLKCGIKVQNGTNTFKQGFPVPKYLSMHVGMNFRNTCTLSRQRYQTQQIENAEENFISQSLSFEIKHELAIDVWTGEPQSHFSWALFSYPFAYK